MSSRKTVLYAVALAGVVALGLAGCNGGDEEPTKSATPTTSTPSTSGSPSASTSGSSTGSITPSPSVSVSVPAAARAHTEAGAIEFAKFYLLEMDKAYVSTDDAVVRALAGASCEGCQDMLKGVAEMKAAGERQVRPSLSISGTNPLPGGTADLRDVQLHVKSVEVDVVNKQDTVVSSTEAGQGIYRLAVRWVGDHWTTADMGIEQ